MSAHTGPVDSKSGNVADEFGALQGLPETSYHQEKPNLPTWQHPSRKHHEAPSQGQNRIINAEFPLSPQIDPLASLYKQAITSAPAVAGIPFAIPSIS